MRLEDYLEFIDPLTIRIKGHRIGLEHVIKLYQEGYSPEQIALEFPGLSLEKIYGVIAYYLHNKDEIDVYMAQLAAWVEARMREDETKETPPVVQRLRILKAQRKKKHDAHEDALSSR